MTDFLDCIRTTLIDWQTTSRIECDTDGCGKSISVPNDIDEHQAAQIARTAGWSAQMGTARWYHRCPRHSEGSKR